MNKNIKYIIENIVNFNPVDYQDSENDIITNNDITTVIYKYFPKTRKELEKIIIERLKENIKEPYLNDINTSEITDMSNLFSSLYSDYLYKNGINSKKIKKLDLSNFNTSKCTNMTGMFWKCSSLEELDISNWDTSKVTDMSWMFFRCESLKELNIYAWDISKVTDTCFMFFRCESLEDLDLPDWDISSETDTHNMFDGCKKTIIPAYYKSGLMENNLNFNPADYTDDENNLISSQEIEECIIKPKDKDELCKLICKRYEQNPEYPYLLDIDTSDITDMSGIFSPILSAGIVSGNPYLNKYFSYRESLKIKMLDLSTWDTSKVTDMSYMFWSCSQECIKEIKIKNFDTSNVTNMQGMFGFCNNITKLDLSNFDTSNVKNMENMFDNCISLIDLDLSNFNVVNVASMARMFRNCNSLVSLNINGWDMSNVTDISYMFSNCYKLTDIDFSNFNVNVINTEFGLWGTFSGNDALKYKYDISKI